MVRFDPADLVSWCGGTWQGQPPISLAGVSHDTRSLQAGALYVALRGEQFDGHDFVSNARVQRAGAALVSADAVPHMHRDLPLLVVPDTRRALIELAAGHRQRCAGEFIGITGSVGKTSVKEMTADVLAHLGPVTRTWSNWNNDIGLPLSMLRMNPQDAFGVFEVGMNHPGELAPLCVLLQAQRAIITPIGPVHLEHFDSVAAIVEEKATLSKSVPEEGQAILSIDDPWYEVLRERTQSRIVRVSLLSQDADYFAEADTSTLSELSVCERHTGECFSYRLPLPGRYVADNAIRVIALARELGLSPDVIAHALSGYQPPAMRWQRHDVQGVSYINDAYNANPMSMRAAIDAMQEMAVDGQRWLVLAGMFELGAQEREEHEELGQYIAQFPWAGVITVGRHGEMIAEGLKAAQSRADMALMVCTDHQEAGRYLKERVQPGDVVLLKASRGERLERVLEEV